MSARSRKSLTDEDGVDGPFERAIAQAEDNLEIRLVGVAESIAREMDLDGASEQLADDHDAVCKAIVELGRARESEAALLEALRHAAAFVAMLDYADRNDDRLMALRMYRAAIAKAEDRS